MRASATDMSSMSPATASFSQLCQENGSLSPNPHLCGLAYRFLFFCQSCCAKPFGFSLARGCLFFDKLCRNGSRVSSLGFNFRRLRRGIGGVHSGLFLRVVLPAALFRIEDALILYVARWGHKERDPTYRTGWIIQIGKSHHS